MKRSDNFEGPWSGPPRRQHFDNHYLIKIIVYDPIKDKDITEKVIDYGNYEDRKFLGRLTHWAMENNYNIDMEKVAKD